MSKGKKKKTSKRKKQAGRETGFPAFQWMDEDGMHMAAPGSPPPPEQLEKMTEEYQKHIRNSPMWDLMVKQFGAEKAEEMLKEFHLKFGRGFGVAQVIGDGQALGGWEP
ncbi:MAG: hypothetical protein DDT28_00335 [Dehalococcoidia bacterium]|nr:hypothetical protein [Chloroflexota bacterium]